MRQDSEAGFTLVELMVVVLIIAILIAIAIPTFLGARTRAQDRAAQSNIRNTLTAAKVYYSDESADYNFDVPALLEVDPQIIYTAGLAPVPGQVGFVIHPNQDGMDFQAVQIVAQSASGMWFCLWDEGSGSAAGSYYGSDVAAAPADYAACQTGW